MSRNVCPICEGTGWARRVSEAGIEGVARCECFRQSRLERLYAAAQIPQRYEHCELANFAFMPSMHKSIDIARVAAERFVEEYPMPQPFGLLFMGPQGVGKTHLAASIIKELMKRKSIPCLFCSFQELLKAIQNSYNPVSQASELSLLAPVLDAEVLVLDELGAQNPSVWVLDTVGYVLNYRYNANKVTVVTTNYLDTDREFKAGTPDSLARRIGERMRSRLFEMCKTIQVSGEDFRKNINQAGYRF